MKKKIAKIIFGLLWLFLFYQLLFNPSIRRPLLLFCTQHPYLAPMILVQVQLALASFALPCSPLSVLAGVLWGVQLGILYSTLATVISSLWTFFLGRYVLKNWLEKQNTIGWWMKISNLIIRYRWKASMVAHANPIFPGSSLGYMFGASSISLKAFLLGVVMGTLPLQLLTVTLGDLASKSFSGFDINSIYVAIGIIATFIIYKIFMPSILNRLDKKRGKKL